MQKLDNHARTLRCTTNYCRGTFAAAHVHAGASVSCARAQRAHHNLPAIHLGFPDAILVCAHRMHAGRLDHLPVLRLVGPRALMLLCVSLQGTRW